MTAADAMVNWYVVRTQSRRERVAEQNLHRQDFEVYLPVYKRRVRHARRTVVRDAPMFPGYLFVAMDLESVRWRAIQSTIGVLHLVCHGDRPTPLPREVVTQLRAREDEDGAIGLHRWRGFDPGDKVQVVDGPLADCHGIFQCADDMDRVTILLDLLGRQVRVQVPATDISAAA